MTTTKLHSSSLALVLGTTAIVAVIGTSLWFYPSRTDQDETYVNDYVLGLTPIVSKNKMSQYPQSFVSFWNGYWNRWKRLAWYQGFQATTTTMRGITTSSTSSSLSAVMRNLPLPTTKQQDEEQQVELSEEVKPMVSKTVLAPSFTPNRSNGTFTHDDQEEDEEDTPPPLPPPPPPPKKDTTTTIMDSTTKSDKNGNDDLHMHNSIKQVPSTDSSLDATMDETISIDDTTTTCTEEMNLTEFTTPSVPPLRRRIFSNMVQYRYIQTTPSSYSPSSSSTTTKQEGLKGANRHSFIL